MLLPLSMTVRILSVINVNQLILQFYEQLILEKEGHMPDPELHFLLRMYCRGSIAMTVDWVLTGMKLTPSELAALLTDAIPPKLAEILL